MSQARSTILAVVATATAWGGFLAYRQLTKPTPPESPVAVESTQEKADSIQAAFARGAEVDDAEVEGFLTQLQAAVRERNTERVTGMLAPARLLDGVEATTGQSLPPAARSMLEGQLAAEMVEFFDPTVVEHQVKRIDRDAQGNIVVYLRLVDVDRISVKARWWLYHDGTGLRWWDGEDLQLGMRISTAMSAGIAAAASPGRAPAIERFVEVIGRLAEIDMTDPAQVRTLAEDLDRLDMQPLPPSFRHLGLTARAVTAVALGNSEEALRRLDTLESEPLQELDMPMRHYLRAQASLALQRWSDAVTSIERFLALLGEDAEAYHLLGMAKLGSGDAAAAMAAFDKGLADDPRLSSNYGGAAMAGSDTPSLVERLRKAPDDAVLDGAAQWLEDAEDLPGLTRLLDAASQARPSWDQTRWRALVAALQASDP